MIFDSEVLLTGQIFEFCDTKLDFIFQGTRTLLRLQWLPQLDEQVTSRMHRILCSVYLYCTVLHKFAKRRTCLITARQKTLFCNFRQQQVRFCSISSRRPLAPQQSLLRLIFESQIALASWSSQHSR